MENYHFYIFQDPNSFEGPPSHIQFIDMPVDSSYMDGVGIFSDMDEFCTSIDLCLHGLYMDVAKMKLLFQNKWMNFQIQCFHPPSFSEPPFDG